MPKFHSHHKGAWSNCRWYCSSCYIPPDKILKLKFLNRFIMPLCHWAAFSNCQWYYSSSASSLSYREFIECRYIGLFRISNSISYRTSHIEYLDILKTNDFFVFFRRKFQKIAENSENSPKILKIRRKFAENSENSPKILKIRRKFLKKKVFFEALISYRIVSYREKNPHIVSISYRVEKKLIAQGCSWCMYLLQAWYW